MSKRLSVRRPPGASRAPRSGGGAIASRRDSLAADRPPSRKDWTIAASPEIPTIPPDCPPPPLDLARRPLPIEATGAVWLRIYRDGYEPIFFGTTGHNRFDDPFRRYGVLYAAEMLDGAFIETFGRTPGFNLVSVDQLAVRSLVAIESSRPLHLVDLTGPGLARIGATAYVTAGAHACAQLWSRALWSHPSRPDGLLFRARHDPDCRCVAIFSRTHRFVRAVPQGGLLDPARRPMLGATLRRYGFSLVGAV